MKSFFVVLVLLGLSILIQAQVSKPDTLFFRNSRVLPCQIIDVTTEKIEVLSEPSQPEYPWSYRITKISSVSYHGKRDSVNQFVEQFRSKKQLVVEKQRDTLRQNSMMIAAQLHSKAGSNLIFSDILFVGASGFSMWALTTTSQESRDVALVLSAGTGLLGLIMRFVGHAQLYRSGEVILNNASGYFISTSGNNLVFRF